MKWIETSEDNLPEEYQSCFVHVQVDNSGYTMIDTYYERDKDTWLGEYTHWMPLEFPLPPPKQADDDAEWRYDS